MPISEEELKELIEPKAKIERITTISTDGKTLVTRVPKEVVDYKKIEKGDKFRWLVNEKIELELVKENDKKKKNS